MRLVIAKEFSETPGARYRSHGPWSGEEFRDQLLEPKFLEARSQDESLIVDLDGTYGYATSFLEEAFGGLTRSYGRNSVMRTIRIISNDEPGLISDINAYIIEADI